MTSEETSRVSGQGERPYVPLKDKTPGDLEGRRVSREALPSDTAIRLASDVIGKINGEQLPKMTVRVDGEKYTLKMHKTESHGTSITIEGKGKKDIALIRRIITAVENSPQSKGKAPIIEHLRKYKAATNDEIGKHLIHITEDILKDAQDIANETKKAFKKDRPGTLHRFFSGQTKRTIDPSSKKMGDCFRDVLTRFLPREDREITSGNPPRCRPGGALSDRDPEPN